MKRNLIIIMSLLFLASCSPVLAFFSGIKNAKIQALTNEQKRIVDNQVKLENHMKGIKTGLNDITVGFNGNKTGLSDLNENIIKIKADINSVIKNTVELNNQINGVNNSISRKISGNNNVVNDSELFENLFYGACGFLTMLVGGFFKLLGNNKNVAHLRTVISQQKEAKREWRDKYLILKEKYDAA